MQLDLLTTLRRECFFGAPALRDRTFNDFVGIVQAWREDLLEDVEALILAGDIANMPGSLDIRFRVSGSGLDLTKAWVLPGNRDVYGGCIDQEDAVRRIGTGFKISANAVL